MPYCPSQPLAFVDLETTGATATSDRITEVGIVEVDCDGSVREWSQLVNPQARISPFIEQLTGISNEMVADAPVFEQIAPEIRRRLDGRLFIAHNARFDYGFLKNEFKRLGASFRATVLCTVKLSRRLQPQHSRHNLDVLISRHGLIASGRHRALADARLIHQLWARLHETLTPELVTDAVKTLTARPSLPPFLDACELEDIPDTPGVYFFYGENALPLYIGKAKDLRSRILSHFSGDHASSKEMSLAQQIRRVDWLETAGEIGALLKEAALIKSMQPLHNRQLRSSSDACTVLLVDAGDGWLQPRIVALGELDPRQDSRLFGLFKSPKEATETLTNLMHEKGLCAALLGLQKVAAGKPCFGHQLKRCAGACVGKETPAAHSLRLVAALTRLKLKAWPFPGPALLREGGAPEVAHVVDHWCYLGSARSDDELRALLDGRTPRFDRDTYKILVKYLDKLTPIAGESSLSPAR